MSVSNPQSNQADTLRDKFLDELSKTVGMENVIQLIDRYVAAHTEAEVVAARIDELNKVGFEFSGYTAETLAVIRELEKAQKACDEIERQDQCGCDSYLPRRINELKKELHGNSNY